MERSLAVMGGAGRLPALVAAQARRRGFRVVAFAFEDAAELAPHADVVVPSRVTEAGDVMARVQVEGVTAAVLCGRFSMPGILQASAENADDTSRAMAARAGGRIDARLVEAVIATLAVLGVEVLDQREFLGDLLAPAGCLSARHPSQEEWLEVRRGLSLARLVADAGIGQTVVVHRGQVTAVEAVDGTTAAIRRGCGLGGAGGVIVKAAARDHDYRFDTPAVGIETVEAAAEGAAAVLAVEVGRVMILDADAVRRAADAAGIALLSVDEPR